MKRREFIAAGLGLAMYARVGGAAPTKKGPSTADSMDVEVWQGLRQQLFGGREIALDADDVIGLETPYRAADAASVPIAMRGHLDGSDGRYIKRMWLLIDQNPTPVVGVFEFFPESAGADVETRVRVNDYTFVRAIAETSDDKLYMTANLVKASGGCSAPASKDPAAAAQSLGRMKLRIDPPVQPGGAARAQVLIRHPNVTGLAMDQLTRMYPQPHYVRKITVSYRDRPVMNAEVTFAIAENPSFRFNFRHDGAGVLVVHAEDTEDTQFEARARVDENGMS